MKREKEEEAKKSRKINEFFVKTTAEVPKNELSISETTDNRADNHSKIDAKSDSNDNVELSSFSDIGELPDNPSAAVIEQFLSEGPHLPKNSDIPMDVENSPFPSYVLQTKLNNGEIIKRDWLAYSPSKQAIYCFPFKLFQNDVKTPSNLVSSGWDKSKGWKKLYNRIPYR